MLVLQRCWTVWYLHVRSIVVLLLVLIHYHGGAALASNRIITSLMHNLVSVVIIVLSSWIIILKWVIQIWITPLSHAQTVGFEVHVLIVLSWLLLNMLVHLGNGSLCRSGLQYRLSVIVIIVNATVDEPIIRILKSWLLKFLIVNIFPEIARILLHHLEVRHTVWIIFRQIELGWLLRDACLCHESLLSLLLSCIRSRSRQRRHNLTRPRLQSSWLLRLCLYSFLINILSLLE